MVVVVVVILVSSGGTCAGSCNLATRLCCQLQRNATASAKLVLRWIHATAQAARSGDGSGGFGAVSRRAIWPHGMRFQALDGEAGRRYGFGARLRAPHLGFQILKEIVDRMRDGTIRFVVGGNGNTAGWVLLLIVQNDLPAKENLPHPF